jgi:DNA repair ATPase RecN
MFKELNDNLASIEGEVTKLKTAVQHIDTAKAAAQAAVSAANTTNTEFKEHLQKVTKAVDSILKPHEDLIAATESLTKTIAQIDFPNRLEQQAKELKLIKTILLVVCGLVVLGTVLTILILKK